VKGISVALVMIFFMLILISKIGLKRANLKSKIVITTDMFKLNFTWYNDDLI